MAPEGKKFQSLCLLGREEAITLVELLKTTTKKDEQVVSGLKSIQNAEVPRHGVEALPQACPCATSVYLLLSYSLYMVLGIKPRTLCVLNKYSTTELHCQ